MSKKASNTFDISRGGSFKITLIFALSTLTSTALRTPVLSESVGSSSRIHILDYKDGVLKFEISRRFFERCFDLIISIDGDFFKWRIFGIGFRVRVSSTVIAMNSSNSAKISSSRRVPSMECRILLPSSRRVSKSSSKISSMISILKHVSSFEYEFFIAE
ncbi:hypothetical protein Tco_0542379 [Tanacetum coccineum]